MRGTIRATITLRIPIAQYTRAPVHGVLIHGAVRTALWSTPPWCRVRNKIHNIIHNDFVWKFERTKPSETHISGIVEISKNY